MNGTPLNTTSVNVATNTPAIIARKRGVESALIVIAAGAIVDALEAVVQVMSCKPGVPCTYDWALLLNVALTAVLGGIARGVTAYFAAHANVIANAVLQPVPAQPDVAAAAATSHTKEPP